MPRDADWEMFCRGKVINDDAPWAPLELIPRPVPLEPDDEGDDPPGAAGGAVGHFHARIVGVVYPNADGTSRREAVRQLRRLERVRLAHRPDNPVDVNAVAVLREPDGMQLGYLPAAVAKGVVAAARERGTRYLALVAEAGGGETDDLISVGPVRADLLVLTLEHGATKATARRYLLGWVNRA